MKNNKKFLYVFLIIFCFFCGCATMYGITRYLPIKIMQNVTKLEKDVTVTDAGIADAVEKVYDSVVVVLTYKDDTAIASGTGFIYKKDDGKYYILTNYHVIDGGNKVKIDLTTDEEIEVKVVGHDENADIAVLSLETNKDYPIATTGNSLDMRIGDTTFTVGAPLDSSTYSWTVTRGILSGKNRLIEVEDNIVNVLQTDASINNGNSGGPLCNSNGEVIGINSLKLVSDGVEGMGFAIPIENAMSTADGIISGHPKINPYIGVSMVNIRDVMSLSNFNYRNYYMLFAENVEKANLTEGVGVVEVTKNSPASQANIEAGDIITKINDEKVDTRAYLKYNLYKYNVGDEIKVTLYRDGKEKTVTVKLGSNEETS